MKTRLGFVSNSSSSSFVIPVAALTEFQKACLIDHIEASNIIRKFLNHEIDPDYEAWRVKESKGWIKGWTSMDNFDIQWLMRQIGIPLHLVQWDEGYEEPEDPLDDGAF